MSNVINYLKEIYWITRESHGNILVFPIIFLISAFLEVLSITLLSSYIVMLLSSDTELRDVGNLFLKYMQFTEFKEAIKIFGVALVLAFTLKLLFFIFQNFLLFKYSLKLQLILRKKLMHSYLNLEYEKFSEKNTSEYIQTVSGLVNQFAGGTLILILRTFSDIIIGLGILLFLFIQNSTIMISLLVIFGTVGLVYDLAIKRRLREAGIKASVTNASIHQNIAEAFRGFKEIRILGVENYFTQKILDGSRKMITYQTISQLGSIVPRQILEYALVIFLVVLVSYGLSSSSMEVNFLLTLATFSYAGLRLLPIVSSMIVTMGSLRYGRDTVSRLYTAITNNNENHISPTIAESNSNSILDGEVFESLELQQVDFAYRGREICILKNVSMSIHAGELIGIKGESGAGKSTLIEIIMGIVKPSAGKILFNKRAIDLSGNVLENYWKKEACYLPQDIFVIDESIEKNITLKDQINKDDTDRIIDALKKSSLESFMLENRLKLNMNLGEGGNKLSGGQRQRVAISRMFFHNRNFLILDEATSALDNVTQKEIMSQILSVKNKKTIILISHREETLIECDKVYEIRNRSVIKL
jgi:ABC-type multidrug transport system fused ATPase/permease subunit